MGTLFAIAFGGIFLYMLFGVIRYKGLRGAMFRCNIDGTIGEVKGSNTGMLNTKLRVLALDSSNNPEKKVGLELVATSLLSYQMMPISLSSAETTNLIAFLQQGITDKKVPLPPNIK